ncbi:hypothetical protein SAY86_005630 [Trapa natans]|uniref:WRKY domain-containing protein n=1 Tax=Trapa natans TaxID=22666 RepID=A0AAN7QSP0_TRANT|nr:hypothetical protein SAY86_005630 [Trapa natans]
MDEAPKSLILKGWKLAFSSDSMRGSGASSQGDLTSRLEVAERRVIRVAVPEIGNPELPPDDGHTWRKYGQKRILNSIFPRGYYRCTHQKSYQCPAKKTVQRLDVDPSILEVTYINHHICHLSSTAPSLAPPPPPHLLPSGGVVVNHLLTSAASNSGKMWLPLSTETGEGDAEYGVVHMADTMFNSGGAAGTSNSFMDLLIFQANAKDDSSVIRHGINL